MTLKNILFVCEGNAQRSPTFEIWFKKNRPQYNTKSTGCCWGYPERMTTELLEWADTIFIMDLEQERFINRKFPEFLDKIEMIGCGDYYGRETKELYRVIEFWVNRRNL